MPGDYGDLMKAALEDATAFTEALLEAMPGALCVVDEQLRPVLWNRNFGRNIDLKGRDPRELDMLEFYRPEDLPRIRDAIKRTFAGEVTSLRCDFLGKGEPVPYVYNAARVMLAGKPHIIVIGTDLSELQKP